jgi:hypothetical protein
MTNIEEPPWLNAPPVDPYPFEETYDLRTGPPLHPALQALLPYIGLWRGRGRGGYPTIDDFDYGQEITIAHDGRPFLSYQSRAWILDEESKPVRPAGRESGWWRPVMVDGAATGDLEVLIVTPTGIMEMHLGRIDGTRVEIATDLVLRTPTAKEVTAGHRLYGIVEGALLYAQDMAAVGEGMSPHLSARLLRVGG